MTTNGDTVSATTSPIATETVEEALDGAGQSPPRVAPDVRAQLQDDKTERQRRRSLRAIIRATDRCSTRSGLRSTVHRTSVGADGPEASIQGSLHVHLDEGRGLSGTLVEQEMKLIPNVASPSLTFTKLRPTEDSIAEETPSETPDTLHEIQIWLESFKKELQEIVCHGEESACDAYIQLLCQVHPELTSIVKDQQPNLKQQRPSTRKRSITTMADTNASQTVPEEWEPFFTGMREWVGRLETYVSTEAVEHHGLIWERARLSFILKTMQDVVEKLTVSADVAHTSAKPSESFTGGVSFIKRSESHQYNVDDEYLPLPPVVIQPPNLKRIQSPSISKMIDRIISDEVTLVRMTDRDDTVIKNYLLKNTERNSFMRSTSGAVCRVIKGMGDISMLLSDHVFLCCHYVFDAGQEMLTPCLETKKGVSFGIEDSNVQLVIVVRKGIGGTWALRNAARSLDAAQVLSLLMGSQSVNDIDFGNDFNRSFDKGRKRLCPSSATFRTPTRTAGKRTGSIRSIPVLGRRGREKTPVVTPGSLLDWFASVRSTAAQIVESASTDVAGASKKRRNQSDCNESDSIRIRRQADDHHSEQHSKTTAEFIQKTLKRRLTSCNNAAPSNVKIHTLSCRLEMFVDAELWKSLDSAQRHVLNSVVMGVEEYLQVKIQDWNRERMIEYAKDMIALMKQKIEGLNEKIPGLYSGNAARPQSTQLFAATTKKAFTLSEMVRGTFLNDSVKIEDQPPSDLSEMLPQVPRLPNADDHLSAGIVKASAIASSVHTIGQSDIPWPFYLINTRDCFTYDLIEVKRKMLVGGKEFVKTDFYFAPDQVPEDYGAQRNPGSAQSSESDAYETVPFDFINKADWKEVAGYPSEPPNGAAAVGVTTYTSLFSHDELSAIETCADDVHENAQLGMYPPECYHPTVGKNGALKRTKYFFGARYLWTKEQLADRDAGVARGVRVDVPPNPVWMKSLVESPLISSGIAPVGFINSWALNMYHDGSEGIQSHFDDSQRFCQPIYSLRLFSDSRLSFGTQLYGFTNGAFYVPMPRGCITIMHDKSYAANAIKHCVRPCDMTGKSAGLIMRKINDVAWKEAVQHHLNETVGWLERFHVSVDASKHRSGDQRIHQLKGEAQMQAEVRSVMAGLLRNVTKNLNQENVSEKKHRKVEAKVAKQIVDGLVKAVEATEKQSQRDKKVQQQQNFQVKSVVESMIKKVEKNTAPPKRKRKESVGAFSSVLNKKEKHDEERRSTLTYGSVLQAANKILENLMKGNDNPAIQSLSMILKKHGPSWIQAQHNAERDEATMSILFQEAKATTRTGNQEVDGDEPCAQSIAHETAFFALPSTHIQEPSSARFEWGESNVMNPSTSGSICWSREDVSAPQVSCCESPERSTETRVSLSDKFSSLAQEARSRQITTVDPPCQDQTRHADVKEVEVESDCRRQLSLILEHSTTQRHFLASLLKAVLNEVVQSVPDELTEYCSQHQSHSALLSEEILKHFTEETNSVDFGSLPVTPSPSIKSEEATRKDSGKRTYKLVSSDVCFSCERPGYNPRSYCKGAPS